jgi:hypothetical protein
MKLRIALLSAGAALALAATVAHAGDDKDKGEVRKFECRIVVMGPGDKGPEGMKRHEMKDGEKGERHVFVMGGPGEGPHGKIDANGDGVVTKDEFLAMHNAMFAKIDKNNNGRIDKDEMEAHHGPGGPMQIRMRHPGGPDGPRGPGGPMGCEGGPHGEGHDVMILRHGGPEGMAGPHMRGREDLDANKDGKVSFEEFVAPLRDAFGRMDKDKSGFLEKGESPDGNVIVHRIEKTEKK